MPIEKMTIAGSSRVNLPDGRAGWCVATTLIMDGQEKKINHFFPDEAILFRAAEYHISPKDIDTILDIILHENYITLDEIDPRTTVYGEAGVDETRQAHIGRCARVKLRHRTSTRSNKSVLMKKAADPNDPTTLADVEADHPLHPIRTHMADNPVPHDVMRWALEMIAQARKGPENVNINPQIGPA